MSLPAYPDIERAAARIAPYARRTPVLNDPRLDAEIGAQLWFKCEGLQHIGAFKFRGACNAVLALSEAVAARGVLTHSSGNHGAALGEAARLRGIPAHIVVPDGANPVKLANIEATGATLHRCAATLAAREAKAEQVRAETGATLVHPYEDPWVIAGQGTAARELHEEVPDLDVLMVPLGGGGLAAGTCLATAHLAPRCRVIVVEPESANDGQVGLARGERLESWPVDTLCDGLRTMVGRPNFTILQAHGAQVLTAPDADTELAVARLQRALRVQVEPSSAVVFAALKRQAAAFQGRRIGIILSGGNCL